MSEQIKFGPVLAWSEVVSGTYQRISDAAETDVESNVIKSMTDYLMVRYPSLANDPDKVAATVEGAVDDAFDLIWETER